MRKPGFFLGSGMLLLKRYSIPSLGRGADGEINLKIFKLCLFRFTGAITLKSAIET